MSITEWRYAAVAAVATTAGAVGSKALDLFSRSRLNSGQIETSDAESLWQHMERELERLERRIDKLEGINLDLQVVNTELTEKNLALVLANDGLISELDQLKSEYDDLVKKHAALLEVAAKRELQIDALLEQVGGENGERTIRVER